MYCTQCGTQAGDGGNFCANCGRSLAATAVAAPVQDSVFASFWLRVGAHLIDQAILTAVSWVCMFVVFMGFFGVAMSSLKPPHAAAWPFAYGYVWFWAFMVGTPWLYHALFESSSRQATPGKLACGIKVTDLAGDRISFGRATGRYFATWISNLTFLIGYLMVGFTEKRQALHDVIAKTLVVGAKTEAGQVGIAPPARQMSGLAIAAIAAACILPVVAVLGILAAIAIPAYQDYTIRTQVSEGLILASGYKARVQAYVAEKGRWPESQADLQDRESLEKSVDASGYVDSIEIWNGTVVIAYGSQANTSIRDHLVSLRPFLTEEQGIVWQCGNATMADDDTIQAKPAGEGATDSDVGVTSVVDRYLPASCRSGFEQSTEAVD